MSTQDIQVNLIDNRDQSRFEFELEDDKIGTIDYKLLGRKMRIMKTEVPEDLRGNGYGSAMVESMLSHIDDIRWKIVPVCSFVKDHIEQTDKWNHLVYKTDTHYDQQKPGLKGYMF